MKDDDLAGLLLQPRPWEQAMERVEMEQISVTNWDLKSESCPIFSHWENREKMEGGNGKEWENVWNFEWGGFKDSKAMCGFSSACVF